MPDLFTALVPVGSLAMGSLLTMIAQGLSDRRAHGREREARREEFRLRQYERERDAIIAMQVALESCADIYTIQISPYIIDSEHTREDLGVALSELGTLINRVLDDDARHETLQYYYICFYIFHRGKIDESVAGDRDLYDAAGSAYGKAQAAIFTALERDPFGSK